MRLYLLIIFLLFVLPCGLLAQSQTCPRIERDGDTLLTDPAATIQWYRNGVAIPGAKAEKYVPTNPEERAQYSVEARGAKSAAYSYIGPVENANFVVAGFVFDELYKPVAGAIVKLGAVSATTNDAGRFVLPSKSTKPAEATPVLLTITKEGFWTNNTRQYLHEDFATETRLMLRSQSITNRVDAKKGGQMAYQGFSLELPPNAVQTESGTPYTGTINLSVTGALPSDPDFGLRMPGGDFSAIDERGNDVMLYSYGFLTAEMRSESGQTLELKPEATATLRFNLPWKAAKTAPDSVPLWHFNESTALWEQEGWSIRNGSIYEGQVKHFSSWNCDVPAERARVKGRVVGCDSTPVRGGRVQVGQRSLTSDSVGNY